MPGAVFRTQDTGSVFDPYWVRVARRIASAVGMADPQSQVMGIAAGVDVPGDVGGLIGMVREKFPKLAEHIIKAYHGSPHDFERFSLEKIGTGEGAQAYGHGLYFAENPRVAAEYADALGNVQRLQKPAAYGGVEYPPGTDRHRALLDVVDVGKDKALQRLDASIRFNQTYAPDRAALETSLREWLQNVEPSQISAGLKGKTYEVAIKAHPDQFLDWDKPLSEQSPYVQQSLETIGIKPRTPDEAWMAKYEYAKRLYEKPFHHLNPIEKQEVLRSVALNEPTVGAQVYRLAGKDAAEGKIEAAKRLQDAGIAGIKYLDQGSRAAGEGSRNYVVFDDKTIDILKKYGLLLPAAGATLPQGSADARD